MPIKEVSQVINLKDFISPQKVCDMYIYFIPKSEMSYTLLQKFNRQACSVYVY